jgi:serine/threonine-protein kinase
MLFEARAAAKLRSSHVVRVLDVARLESGAPYIVMERLEGCDLASVVEGGPLSAQRAVDYVLQACEGLVEAHALGIVHRDLKPENLFLAATPEGEVLKVLDFGISKDTRDNEALGPRSIKTSAGYAVGSPYYMAPEQMRASQQLDQRADIWSLGAILYELISGHCPFEGDSLPLVCAAVLDDREAPSLRTLAHDAPEGLSVIVARCLRKSREERYASVAELAADLRAFASPEGQRSADRSQRPASGIQLRSDRASTTPVRALARSTAPTLLQRKPSRLRYAPLGLLALALFALGAMVVAKGVPSARPPAAAEGGDPELSSEAVTIKSPPTPIAPVVSSPVEAAVPARAASAPAPEKSKPARARPAGSSADSASSSAPPRSNQARAESVTPSASPATAPSANTLKDAWDPDRLGGRY